MVHTIPMNLGTWLFEDDETIAHNADDHMKVGFLYTTSECRPLINFTNTLYSGEILSAKLYIYSSDAGGQPWVTGYKVNRVYSAASCWGQGRPWTIAGCEGITEDRSNTELFTGTQIVGTGWTAIPVANLIELLAVTEGNDTVLLTGSAAAATIAKSPAPYLEIITLDPTGIIMF